ncbi:MAG: hypothetical protein JNG86_14800, partial [Verrucomicrobiaceae bacterium]|nr:hypothetical protein [Verrucomicrobiaceae bacterium]
MTFRAKLLRAILAIVVITTAASLFIAQRQNAALMQGVVEQLFAERMKAFQQTQALPIQAAKAEVKRLTQSVRLFAALEEGDPEIAYQTAGDELRRGDFAFFRLLDKDRKLMPTGPESRAGVFDEKNLTGELLPRGKGGTEVDLGFVATPQGAVYLLLACTITNFD